MKLVTTALMVPLCLCLTFSSLGFAMSEAYKITGDTAAPAPIAYVYIATSKGINLYDTAANGSISLVSGSPFNQTSGLMIGSNGKTFITLGTDYIHAYSIALNGTIGKQVSEINTQYYSGSQCGTTAGAVLDHTGQYLFANLAGFYNAGNSCFDVQTYKISASSGDLSFDGDSWYYDLAEGNHPPLSIIANGKLAYSQAGVRDACQQQITAYDRDSSGALLYISIVEKDPPPLNPQSDNAIYFIPNGPIAPDPATHFAVAVIPQNSGPCGTTYSAELASYSVATNGDIATTNTGNDMPTPLVYPSVLTMSPSGKLLAIAGDGGNNGENGTPYGSPGVQVLHFNGASPMTAYSAALTTDPIDEIRWDNSNHLYALSNSTGKLFVYTITPTSIEPVAGSPFSIPNRPTGLVVVPK